MGDRTNLVMILAGELLRKAEYLLTMGLHPSEVVLGYELARDKAMEELESTLGLAHFLLKKTKLTRDDRVDAQNFGDAFDDREPRVGAETNARL